MSRACATSQPSCTREASGLPEGTRGVARASILRHTGDATIRRIIRLLAERNYEEVY